ncbi:hypothetical protein ACQPZZ_05140 [Microbispora sp. CA-135349]|uniref:hypothetical protein n=1 Tax=Microbispora sp. CA-135349 TaxID=3239953 RepID=UPI003D89D914
MTRTTPAPPVDVTKKFPELVEYARTTVRLHPRPGTPAVRDSHIGGPLLWPAGEAWPTCDAPILDVAGNLNQWRPDSPIPLVGVAQFFKRDIPEIPFPEDKDLLQLLWCPNEHQQHDISGPAIQLIWRRTADLIDVATGPIGLDMPAIAEKDYLPRPCVLHPERVTEYPYSEELPEDIEAAVDEWDEETEGHYQSLLSIAPGCKIGGWESWHLTDMYELPCPVCGTETEPLLKLASSEWDGGSGPRWQPCEERHLVSGEPEYRDAHEPTALNLGRWGDLTIFVCPMSSEHGFRMTIQ